MASQPEQEADVHREARAIVASARALLQELVEEDVTAFERLPASLSTSTGATSTGATSTGATSTGAGTSPSDPSASRDARPRGPAPSASDAPAPQPPAARSTPARGEEPPTGSGPSMPWHDRRPTLEEVQAHLGDCTRCGLSGGRRTIVFGDGNPAASLMFIGEGPGEQEDRSGLPFVGRAGELLTQMIEKGIGIPRSDVYICNIVKCRPPQNRTPLPPEVSACRPFLDGQIAAVAPKVIVTLGKPAASLLLDREVAITRLRGTWQDYQGIPLMPTLHPAYVLRQYTEENRRAVWQDLKAAFERSQA